VALECSLPTAPTKSFVSFFFSSSPSRSSSSSLLFFFSTSLLSHRLHSPPLLLSLSSSLSLSSFSSLSPHFQVVAAAATTLAVLWAAHTLLGLGPSKKRPVWLVDFECYRVPERLRAPRDLIVKAMRRKNLFTEENILFQEAILDRSGLGDATGLSDAILRMNEGDVRTSLRDSLDETEMIMYEIVDDLLKKTGRDPKEIDAVITSCSCFAPTPSMAAMLVNKFRMRRDVLTYSMAGMGCSSSLVCIDLAKHLLQALPNRRILVVNHENITNNWYEKKIFFLLRSRARGGRGRGKTKTVSSSFLPFSTLSRTTIPFFPFQIPKNNKNRYVGQDRSMLVVNCLFRLGGACALMSNHPADAKPAKYQLTHTVRTHLGAEDDAFGCMGNGEDADGVMGELLVEGFFEFFFENGFIFSTTTGKKFKKLTLFFLLSSSPTNPTRRLPPQERRRRRRPRPQGQHHLSGPEGPPLGRALQGRARQVLRPGLQEGLRTLPAPHGRPRRHRRARVLPGPHHGPRSPLQGDAGQVWKHLGRIDLVHPRQHRAPPRRQEGRPRLAARVRWGLQVQLGVLEGEGDAVGQALVLGGVPGEHGRGACDGQGRDDRRRALEIERRRGRRRK